MSGKWRPVIGPARGVVGAGNGTGSRVGLAKPWLGPARGEATKGARKNRVGTGRPGLRSDG